MRQQAIANPKNRFLSTEIEYDDESLPFAEVELIEDSTANIIAKNDSPDVSFTYSVNPYRGCNHGCAYCYARPTHEYLSLGAGSDFDTKIIYKPRAGELLKAAFEKTSWQGNTLVFSGVTDCYQPVESKLRLTRQCLEVAALYKNPIGIITKSPLVERDIDVLQELQRVAQAHVSVSIPIFDEKLSRAIEPGVATPKRRIETVRKLHDAGIAVGVMIAPIIPAVSDEGLAYVLEAAKDAGAQWAGYVLLRLPGSVKEVFESRIRKELPDRADKILHRIRETRGGELYQSNFHERQRGTGLYAEQIENTFRILIQKFKLKLRDSFEPRASTFCRPVKPKAQLSLFD